MPTYFIIIISSKHLFIFLFMVTFYSYVKEQSRRYPYTNMAYTEMYYYLYKSVGGLYQILCSASIIVINKRLFLYYLVKKKTRMKF